MELVGITKLIISEGEESNCSRRHVGAIIVDSNNMRILARGHNVCWLGGHCERRESGKDLQLCKALHAEISAIQRLIIKHPYADNLTLYLSCSPCLDCARTIAECGKFLNVYYFEEYPNKEGIWFLRQHGIYTQKLS